MTLKNGRTFYDPSLEMAFRRLEHKINSQKKVKMDQAKESTVEVTRVCHLCKTEVKISAPEEGWKAWTRGTAHIQEALWMLSVDDREILISGICGKCFDGLEE